MIDELEPAGFVVVSLNPLGALYAEIVRAIVEGVRRNPTRLELSRWEDDGGALAGAR